MKSQDIGVVIIGRNEGARLIRCLASVVSQVEIVIYVDSGSTDGSQAAAQDAGAVVVDLDLSQPFTAARARNAGFAYLISNHPSLTYVQFIDGDCELQSGWLSHARAFLAARAEAAVVCGRRRERYPETSVYNRLADQEWDTPVGQAQYCGGDALMRVDALQAVGGFNPSLIAGEEPELCVRLRAAGWTIWRVDAEMTLHDADLTRLSQWWTRNKRAGFAFAEGAAMHGAPPERHGVRQTRSALIWGAVLPIVAITGVAVTPWSLTLLLLWPTQVLRMAYRDQNLTRAFFLVLGKLPEAQGAMSYWWQRLLGQRKGLIEYK